MTECTRCGCVDARILRESPHWGGKVARRFECRHCGRRWRHVFDPRELRPVVEARPVVVEVQRIEVEQRVELLRVVEARWPKCPKCGGRTKVASTRKSFRWHKCRNHECSHSFKTPRSPPPQ